MAKTHKTIQISWTIGQADRDRKLRQATDFLEKGMSVQLEYRLRGRELLHMPSCVERANAQVAAMIEADQSIRVSSRHVGEKQYTIILVRKGK